MSFTNSSVSLFEPYHIYYDLNITNNDTNNNNNTPFLEFNETRSNPILDNPSDYFVSVIRFSLETPSLPVFIPAPVIPSSRVALPSPSPAINLYFNLNYYITMGAYNALGVFIEYQQALIWIPEDLNQVQPTTAQVDAGDFDSPYFYGYSYTHFIYNVVNRALAMCYQGLYAIGGLGLTQNTPPFMTWESGSDKATLYAPTPFFDATEPTNRVAPLNAYGNYVRLFFNQALFNLFSSFESYINQKSGTPSSATSGVGKKDYIIKVYNKNNTNIGTLPFNGGGAVAPAVVGYNGSANVVPFLPYQTPDLPQPTPLAPYSLTYIYMPQEYTTTPLWNPVSNITFTTSLLPVNPNLVSTPLIFNSGVVPQSKANIANVLTDLEVPLIVGRDYKPNLLYSPQSEYRLIDLNGNIPLSSIQIGVFWRDAYGHLNPFYLLAGNSATIKLMFRRKDFQTGQTQNN